MARRWMIISGQIAAVLDDIGADAIKNRHAGRRREVDRHGGQRHSTRRARS